MRVGSGPAAGGSLGSVHKKCSSSATLMKIDNPKRKLVVEQFVTTSPGNVTIATTAIAIVLFQVAANNIDPSKLAHGEQKSLHAHVEGRGSSAANGWRWPPTAGQTWWKRSSWARSVVTFAVARFKCRVSFSLRLASQWCSVRLASQPQDLAVGKDVLYISRNPDTKILDVKCVSGLMVGQDCHLLRQGIRALA